jgi:hypothetical protein
MKNIFLYGFIIWAAATMVTMHASAQRSADAVEFNRQPRLFATNFDRSNLPSSPLSEINIKALRDFTQSFKKVEDVRWCKTPNGAVVYFRENGLAAKSVYDDKGDWLYNIRAYTEDNLPKEVRSQVRGIFYDFSVSSVNEITVDLKIIYMVYLEGKTSWKIIRVCDGEIETTDEFEKR